MHVWCRLPVLQCQHHFQHTHLSTSPCLQLPHAALHRTHHQWICPHCCQGLLTMLTMLTCGGDRTTTYFFDNLESGTDYQLFIQCVNKVCVQPRGAPQALGCTHTLLYTHLHSRMQQRRTTAAACSPMLAAGDPRSTSCYREGSDRVWCYK